MGRYTSLTAPLDAARQTLRVARRERVDERAAFDQFCKQVERTPVDGSHGAAAPDATCAVTLRPADGGLRTIRRAYETTVMTVPHSGTTYDSPYVERLAAELGCDLASTVHRATTLTPALKARVLDAASDAHEERVAAIRRIDAETTTLDRTDSLVDDLLAALGGDADTSSRITALERRCRDRARERERALRRADSGSGSESGSPPVDIYTDLAVDDPVLAVLTAVSERLTNGRAGREDVAD